MRLSPPVVASAQPDPVARSAKLNPRRAAHPTRPPVMHLDRWPVTTSAAAEVRVKNSLPRLRSERGSPSHDAAGSYVTRSIGRAHAYESPIPAARP